MTSCIGIFRPHTPHSMTIMSPITHQPTTCHPFLLFSSPPPSSTVHSLAPCPHPGIEPRMLGYNVSYPSPLHAVPPHNPSRHENDTEGNQGWRLKGKGGAYVSTPASSPS